MGPATRLVVWIAVFKTNQLVTVHYHCNTTLTHLKSIHLFQLLTTSQEILKPI